MDCSKIPGIPASKVSHCWSASAGAAMHEKGSSPNRAGCTPGKRFVSVCGLKNVSFRVWQCEEGFVRETSNTHSLHNCSLDYVLQKSFENKSGHEVCLSLRDRM